MPLRFFLVYIRLGCSTHLEISWLFLKFIWEHFKEKIFVNIFLSTYDVIRFDMPIWQIYYSLLFIYKSDRYETFHTCRDDEVLEIPHIIFSIVAEFLMTSSFFEIFKKWWRHQKFRHYGKNKMWNFKNFDIPTSVESFISITFIYKEQWIK